MAAVVMPFPTELTTPPVTNIYLIAIQPSKGIYRPSLYYVWLRGMSRESARMEEKANSL